MNIELKQLQVEFRKEEIIIHYPVWYQETVDKISIMVSEEIQPKQYGIASADTVLYLLLSPTDAEHLPVHVSVENPQIEHVNPKQQ